jgi:hypothetical protein
MCVYQLPVNGFVLGVLKRDIFAKYFGNVFQRLALGL